MGLGTDVEKGLMKAHIAMDRPNDRAAHHPASETVNSEMEWPPVTEREHLGASRAHCEFENLTPRSESQVYGFGASNDDPRVSGFGPRSRLPSPVFGTTGIRASLETQPSIFAANGGRLPENAPTTAYQSAPDFSWIVEHHNEEFIRTIQLQQPNRLAKLLQAARNWRPWATNDTDTTTQSAGDNKTQWQRGNISFRISVAELHRIRMRKLQYKLASHAWHMKRFNKEPPDWEEDLQEYTKAMQDYDYMTKCSVTQRDCFLISGERKVDDYVMHRVGVQTDLHDENKKKPISVLSPWEEENIPIGGTRNENVKKSWVRNFQRRLVIAALDGAFLVAPMWLMVLHNTLYTALVSTTVFVIVFGLSMSALLEKPMDVLSGTAAYAAVLVVFVGLDPSGDPSADASGAAS